MQRHLANLLPLSTIGRSNQLKSLSGIEFNTALRLVDVRGNGAITSLAPLSGLIALRSIGAGGGGAVLDLTPLSGLDAMAAVRLEEVGAGVDLSPLAALPYLATVSLKGTPLEAAQLSALAGFGALRDLDVSSTGLTSLDGGVGAPSLKVLRAASNAITELPEASAWSGVEDLRIGDNPLTSLYALAGVTSLRRLEAPSTEIQSVASLLEIPGFAGDSFLDVQQTPLDVDDCGDLEALTARGVDVRADVDCGR